MESKRVYIGGLYHEATEKDLRQLFARFGDVENVEIKKRSENNVVNFVFAYVNVKTTQPQIAQCFKRLNGTFWKGKRLKLELAKESFLSRLQRERAESGRPAPARPPPPPPPPPRRKTMQDRILDDVLAAKKRRSLDSASAGVVDFTEENETPMPAPVTVATPMENGEHESSSAPKRKKKKKTREPSPPPPVEPGPDEEPLPTRGSLRMFGGIGGESTAPAAVAATSPVSPKAPVSAASPAERGTAGADFLSRLEAFSSVWGDDGDPPTPSHRPPATPAMDSVQPSPLPRRTQSVKSAQEDNEKRMASLRLKQEAFQSQKRALQLALSAKADAPRPNKRIVFDTSDDDEDVSAEPRAGQPARSAGRGPSLFGEEEEEEGETDDFRIRPQYEGEKGRKLRALQEKFGGDARFTLDERFADEDGAAEDDEEHEDAEDTVREEHRQQMHILHGVLGTAAEDHTGDRSTRGSDNGPVRFDPSLESHAQYQLDDKKKKKKKKKSSSDSELPVPEPAPAAPAPAPAPAPVDSGTFYQVAPKLGSLFSRGEQDGGGFSLLKMMGRATEDDEDEKEEYKNQDIKTKTKQSAIDGAAANPFRYDSSSSDGEPEDGSTVPSLGVAAGGDWTQARKFFLQPNDPRLSEGLEWVRAAPSAEELQQRAEQQRPELVELFRTLRQRRQRVLRRGRGRGRRLPGR